MFKKSIIALTLAAAVAIPFSASADNKAKANDNKNCPAQCERNKKGMRQQCANPFDGINLSADQQAKIKALGCPVARPSKEEQAKMKEDRAKMRVEKVKKMKETRANYLAQLKQILTPEQYTQFLENNYLNRPMFNKMNKNGKNGKGDRKAGKRHNNGPRRPAPANS